MKLLCYGFEGQEKFGLLDDVGVICDLLGYVVDIVDDVLMLDGLVRLVVFDVDSLLVVDGSLCFGVCVGNVCKFVVIGLNYVDYVVESGMFVLFELVVFNKWISCIVGLNDDVVIFKGLIKIDWEVELGIVIGKFVCSVLQVEVLEYVVGYCVVNDVFEWEWQFECGVSWDKGKGFDMFGLIGLWMVICDEVLDLCNLGMWFEVDGKCYQDGLIKMMIFGVEELVVYCLKLMMLMLGDVIIIGMLLGVGMGQDFKVFLKGGEVICLGIDGLGEQIQKVCKV